MSGSMPPSEAPFSSTSIGTGMFKAFVWRSVSVIDSWEFSHWQHRNVQGLVLRYSLLIICVLGRGSITMLHRAVRAWQTRTASSCLEYVCACSNLRRFNSSIDASGTI